MNAGPITGGCLCGNTRFVCHAAVGPAAYCHCSDCRKCTGSAFNVSVAIDTQSFALTAGAPKGFTKTGDSGNELTRHFCPDCGSPLYTSSPRHPNRVYVKAGAFDDTSLVRPAYQSWMRSAVDWASIDPGIPGYSTSRP